MPDIDPFPVDPFGSIESQRIALDTIKDRHHDILFSEGIARKAEAMLTDSFPYSVGRYCVAVFYGQDEHGLPVERLSIVAEAENLDQKRFIHVATLGQNFSVEPQADFSHDDAAVVEELVRELQFERSQKLLSNLSYNLFSLLTPQDISH